LTESKLKWAELYFRLSIIERYWTKLHFEIAVIGQKWENLHVHISIMSKLAKRYSGKAVTEAQ